jgi:hypothetical protein
MSEIIEVPFLPSIDRCAKRRTSARVSDRTTLSTHQSVSGAIVCTSAIFGNVCENRSEVYHWWPQ